jgi:hypothetical protein
VAVLWLSALAVVAGIYVVITKLAGLFGDKGQS